MASLLRRRAAGAAVGSFVAIAVTIPPALAADELGLSRDGQVWSAQLRGPLFDPHVRWVPGDERVEAFFVRNQASDGADLAIAVSSADRDRLLARDDITVAARVGGSAWTPLDRVDGHYPLSTRVIASGGTERVQVRAAFDPASTNQSQTKHLRLDFRVVLSAAAAGDGGDDDSDTAGGVLPDTGAPQMGWALLAAAAMIGTGAALVRRSRVEEVSDV